VCLVQQIAKFECKDTRIPQCTLCQILLRSFHIRLFLEFLNSADIFATFRDNIAVFLTRISRLNAHQSQICATLLCQLLQGLDSFVISIIYIRVNRADNNSFIPCNTHFIMKICSSQRNSRKGIAAARLYTNGCLFAQLILDSTCLRLTGCNGNLCISVYCGDLAVNTLHHRLIRIIILEQFDKLLTTHIIRKRPKTFTGTTRKQNNIHVFSPHTTANFLLQIFFSVLSDICLHYLGRFLILCADRNISLQLWFGTGWTHHNRAVIFQQELEHIGLG